MHSTVRRTDDVFGLCPSLCAKIIVEKQFGVAARSHRLIASSASLRRAVAVRIALRSAFLSCV